jgi:hypothetical protein
MSLTISTEGHHEAYAYIPEEFALDGCFDPEGVLVQVGWEYVLRRRSNGKIRGHAQPTPILFRLELARDEKVARRYELLRRRTFVGQLEPVPEPVET